MLMQKLEWMLRQVLLVGRRVNLVPLYFYVLWCLGGGGIVATEYGGLLGELNEDRWLTIRRRKFKWSRGWRGGHSGFRPIVK